MCEPNFQTIDLASARDETTLSSTCDVRFSFTDPNTGDKSEVLAHKLVLALGSEVFMSQFYGPMKEEKDVISIEDSSVEAFKIFMDVVYNKQISLDSLDFKLLAELFYLGEKYQLNPLQKAILKSILTRKMTSENLVDAAQVAEDNPHLDKFSDVIHMICSKFVRNNFDNVLEAFENLEINEENSLTLHKIMSRASKFKPQETVCPNCKHEPCLDDVLVTVDNFVVDALIVRQRRDEPNERKTVRVDGSTVYYVKIVGDDTSEHALEILENSEYVLRYKCREQS